jgi:hypothetical protein
MRKNENIRKLKNLLKKHLMISLLALLIIFLLNLAKKPFIFYLPFNIPGKQMACTIPPFGIFIESKYKNENKKDPCSILKHEKIHWDQYKRMGLFSFHYNYLKCYFNSGRIYNWMENEARLPCKEKSR